MMWVTSSPHACASCAGWTKRSGYSSVTSLGQICVSAPLDAKLLETEVEALLDARRMARANKNYPEADRLRDDLNRNGVVIMDGDPLAWEWHVEEQ